MELSLGGRIKKAWNAFNNKEVLNNTQYYYGSSYKPDRIRLTRGNERSIITSVFNRIALDVSSISIKHCRVDQNEQLKEVLDTSLNNCLTLESNLDQTSRALIQDLVMSMLDDGCCALVPIETSNNLYTSSSFDIYSMRVGKIIQWYPKTVKVLLYNEKIGRREEIILPKNKIAIFENPLYAVINEPNSTAQRLTRKLILLDAVDEQASSGKLDLIIQLPYTIKSQARRDQANERRQDIERQLAGSKYGIAYIDGTEKVTQLNRPLENNLMKQIEYLTSMLYGQLGITQAVLDGTADEKTMLNYFSRTIEPIISVIVDEMKRKFLTKTARSQGQSILYFRDPFKLVPASNLAELADKFTRNEILSSNEFRGILGFKPSDDPKANQLINSNISQPTQPQNGVSQIDKKSLNNEPQDQNNDQYVQEVFDSLTDEQKEAVYYLIDEAINNAKE